MIEENYDMNAQGGQYKDYIVTLKKIRTYFEENHILVKDNMISFLNYIGFIAILQSPDDCESLFAYLQEIESKVVGTEQSQIFSVSLNTCLEAFDDLMNPDKVNNPRRESILNPYLDTWDGNENSESHTDSDNLIEIAYKFKDLLRFIYSNEFENNVIDLKLSPEERIFKISDIAIILPRFPFLTITCSDLLIILEKLYDDKSAQITFHTKIDLDELLKGLENDDNRIKQKKSRNSNSSPVDNMDFENKSMISSLNRNLETKADLEEQFKHAFDQFEEQFNVLTEANEKASSYILILNDFSKFFNFVIKKQITKDLSKLLSEDFGPLEDKNSVLEIISNNFNTLVAKLIDLDNFTSERSKQIKDFKKQAKIFGNCFTAVEQAGKNLGTEIICIQKQLREHESKVENDGTKEDIINKVYQELNNTMIENNSLMIQLCEAKEEIKSLSQELKIRNEDFEVLQHSKDLLAKDYESRLSLLSQENTKLKDNFQKLIQSNDTLNKKLVSNSKKNPGSRIPTISNSISNQEKQQSFYSGHQNLAAIENYHKQRHLNIIKGKPLSIGNQDESIITTESESINNKCNNQSNIEEELSENDIYDMPFIHLQEKCLEINIKLIDLNKKHKLLIESDMKKEMDINNLTDELNDSVFQLKELNYKLELTQDSLNTLETKHFKLNQDYQILNEKQNAQTEKPDQEILLNEIITHKDSLNVEQTLKPHEWENLERCSFHLSYEVLSNEPIVFSYEVFHLEYIINKKQIRELQSTLKLTLCSSIRGPYKQNDILKSKQIYLEFAGCPQPQLKNYFKSTHPIEYESKGKRNKSLNYGIADSSRKSIMKKRNSQLFVNEIHHRIKLRESTLIIPIAINESSEQPINIFQEEYSGIAGTDTQFKQQGINKKKVSFVNDSPIKESDLQPITEELTSTGGELNQDNEEQTISRPTISINKDYLGLSKQAFIINFLSRCNDSVNCHMYSSNIVMYNDTCKGVISKILITKENIYVLNHETNYIETFFDLQSIDQISVSTVNLNLIAFHFYGSIQDLVFEDYHRSSLLDYISKSLSGISRNQPKVVRLLVLRTIRAVLNGSVVKLDGTSDRLLSGVNFENAIKFGYLQIESRSFFGNLNYVERFACLTSIGLFLYEDATKMPVDFIRLENSTSEILSIKMQKALQGDDQLLDNRRNSYESTVTKAFSMNARLEEVEGNYINKTDPYRLIISMTFADGRPPLQLKSPNKVEADDWVSEFQLFVMRIDQRIQASITSCEEKLI